MLINILNAVLYGVIFVLMSGIEDYKKRVRELENDPLVREYAYLQKIIRLAQSPEYKIRVNKPKRVIPEKIIALDKIEKKEENVILKLLRWRGKASTVNELNKAYDEFFYEERDLKYKIRHQFKRGNIYMLRYNDSRKYSFYIAPEWISDGGLKKKYMPNDNDIPLNIESIKIKSFDDKVNKEML